MARIRTLKPEHKGHRKVGRLSDRAYRLWVGLITEADDAGRLVGDVGQLLGTVFPYQRGLTVRKVEAALGELAEGGLIQRYECEGIPFIAFPSWTDHQKQDTHNMRPSKLPQPPPWHLFTQQRLNGDSEQTDPSLCSDLGSRIKDQGSRTKDQGTGNSSSSPWGTPHRLVALYNELAPDESPSVETLSTKRRTKASEYLKQFPEEAWWREAFAQMRRSRFLRGLVKRDGKEPFIADFDWLLTVGKDGTENVVKVHDGRYQDG